MGDRLLSPEKRAERKRWYITVRTPYDYSKISWEQYMRSYDDFQTVRSSFIPYLEVEGEVHWLLGSFHDYPKEILADFGGKCVYSGTRKTQDRSPLGCAIQEVEEESKGLLTQLILKKLGSVKKEIFQIYVGKQYKRRQKVYFFFVPLKYDEVKPIIDDFLRTPEIGEKLGPLDIYKERDIINKKYATTHNLTDFINFLRQ